MGRVSLEGKHTLVGHLICAINHGHGLRIVALGRQLCWETGPSRWEEYEPDRIESRQEIQPYL